MVIFRVKKLFHFQTALFLVSLLFGCGMSTGDIHDDGSAGDSKVTAEISDGRGTDISGTTEAVRKVEVFTGTLPDSSAVPIEDDSELSEESESAIKSTASELALEKVPILQEDMIKFGTKYGDVLLVHEDGEILNIGTEVGSDRYHDGDRGFYYHSLSGIDALVPGYYNYYQTDDFSFDHFYVYSDSSYPQISFMTYTEGDGEELTEENYGKYQDEILDAWEQENGDAYQEQSRTSFTISGYKLREAVIRGYRDDKPVTGCLELMWNPERHVILGVSFFMCDTDGQAYMDDFVTMMTDHIS